jgi:uncharacterized membrane protein YgdD (TMEM256/DUF423 family)
MSPLAPRWIALGSLLAAVGVALGAYGAHGLEKHLSVLGYSGDDLTHRIANHETAVRYQMWHAMAIVLLGVAIATYPTLWWEAAGWAFLLGILIFSGMLYALALVGPEYRWLGAIVPIGGLSLIVGWLLFAIGALRLWLA